MTKGDIVVCVDCTKADYDYLLYDNNLRDSDDIHIGGQYEVLNRSRMGFIVILNDKGIICDYRWNRFKILSEWREDKLKGIGL